MLRLSVLAIFLLVIVMSCAPKQRYICGNGVALSRSSIDNKIIKFEHIGIADTTAVFISGTIFCRDSSEKGEILDTLIMATIVAIEKNKTEPIVGVVSNNDGYYQFYLRPAVYDIKIQFIGYNTLIVEDVALANGDIWVFDAVLGESNGSESPFFKMQLDKTIKKVYPKEKHFK
jgi:hypothetical protein